jgi:hypothetical protein
MSLLEVGDETAWQSRDLGPWGSEVYIVTQEEIDIQYLFFQTVEVWVLDRIFLDFHCY